VTHARTVGRVTDQRRGHLHHDGRDVAVLEVVRAVVKQLRGEFPRGKCAAERDIACPVRSEQIRGQAGEDPHTRVVRDDPAGSARSDDLALRTFCGIPPGGPAHLESLYVPAFGPLAFCMPDLTEADPERHFLASVIVHIETERVQTLLVEGIRRLGSCVRVDRHRHDRGTWLAAEKIEVKEVEPRVFPGDDGVEMMRH